MVTCCGRAPVLAVLTVSLGGSDQAAEATDEAMARALASWDRVSGMDAPIGWSKRVALNVARRQPAPGDRVKIVVVLTCWS
jgi:predicted RNA polymerase sigma factor